MEIFYYAGGVAIAWPISILLMAGVFRLCRISAEETRQMVRERASRRWVVDVIRAIRGLPPVGADARDTPGGTDPPMQA